VGDLEDDPGAQPAQALGGLVDRVDAVVHEERLPAAVVLARLSGMILKSQYLSGDNVSKDTYRRLDIESERALAAGAISGISAYSRIRLPTLPTTAWRPAPLRSASSRRA